MFQDELTQHEEHNLEDVEINLADSQINLEDTVIPCDDQHVTTESTPVRSKDLTPTSDGKIFLFLKSKSYF